MDYFLDTCVEVGYVFCTDPWNDESVEVFNDNDYLNYSHTVKMEFNQKSWQVDLEEEIDERKKEKIIKTLWEFSKSKHLNTESGNPVCKVKTLLIYISKFIRNFSYGLLKRKRAFESKVMIHTRHDKYQELYDKLEENGIHYPDNHIVLDAHDLSLKRNITLEFITADKNMVTNVNCLVDLLNINKFHYLKDFAN